MTDEQKQERRKAIDEYISKVKKRMATVMDLIMNTPLNMYYGWNHETDMNRLSDAESELLGKYLEEARQLSEQISPCMEEMQNRMNICLDHASQKKDETETKDEDVAELYAYGTLDDAFRLSAFAMKSAFLSDRIMRLMEKAGNTGTPDIFQQTIIDQLKQISIDFSACFAAAAADREEKHRAATAGQKEIKEAIKDPEKKEKGQRQRITQAAAAEIAGVNIRTIRNWDRGIGRPEWYPGRGVTAIEFKGRFSDNEKQRRMTRAIRDGIKNPVRPVRFK